MSIRDHWNTILHILLYLYILPCLRRATAQEYTAVSYTVLDEKTFYVMLDENGATAFADFFSLDLTRSWNATKAPLRLLPSLMNTLYPDEAPLIENNDKKSLIHFDSNWTPSLYSTATAKWQIGTRTKRLDMGPSSYSNQVAIDPSTGIAYIPGDPWAGEEVVPVYTYNTLQGYTSNFTKTISIRGPFSSAYRAIWSTVRKSILFYGPEADLLEYKPSTHKWTNHTNSGANIPRILCPSCMASAYNGTKIVMFGGYHDEPNYIYLLEAKTLVWTKGAASKPEYDRCHFACTVAGDYFIVVGGTNSSANKQLVLVYNIKLNRWTDSYEPPQTPNTSTSVENSSTTATAAPVAEQGPSSGEDVTSGAKTAIIAGASSAVVILFISGAFLMRRRKMRKTSQADGIDKNLPNYSPGRTENHKNNPHYPPYPGEDMDRYASQKHECASSPQFNKSMIEPLEYQQQQHAPPQNAFREAPSSSPDDRLRLQGARSPSNNSSKASFTSLDDHFKTEVERNPQHRSSSSRTVADQQWQCAHERQDLQYALPAPSIPIRPTLVQHSRHEPQDPHDRRDRIDHPFSHTQRRFDPQDHTRHSTASRLEFYQSQPIKNPQDHGTQCDEDDGTLYEEIQRIKAQQEEHIRLRLELERVRLKKEAKLHTLVVRANIPCCEVKTEGWVEQRAAF